MLARKSYNSYEDFFIKRSGNTYDMNDFDSDDLDEPDDGYAIPFPEVIRLIEFYPKGNKYRMMFVILAITGCRIRELDNMGLKSIRYPYLIWKCGKNQKGFRKEKLPDWVFFELDLYAQSNPVSEKRLFRRSGSHLRDIVNKKIRPQLRGNWLKKRIISRNASTQGEYIYQLKGLRHNFATLTFYNQFVKWGGTVAVEFTGKRMRHSTYKVTAGHYIGNFNRLDIERFKGKTMQCILKTAKQNKLTEFM